MIVALRVANRFPHPNADNLSVYAFTGPDHPSVQVVGKNDHLYQEGNIVAVALEGAVLTDGTCIRTRRIRGVESAGMALEPTGCVPGTDLTDRYCRQEKIVEESSAETPSHVRWVSVELLHNVRRTLDILHEDAVAAGQEYRYPCISCRAKVKIDGTNMGVQIGVQVGNGGVWAQSRSTMITVQDDKFGFATWVHKNNSYFQGIKASEPMTIFGEWCGKGIQKRTAISKIDRKVFAVFAVQYGKQAAARLEVDPDRIRTLLPEHPDVFVLPWYGPEITLDYGDRDALEKAVGEINRMVAAVEECDPWVAESFGIRGLGEGVVMYPQIEGPVTRDSYTALMFKAKGDKHQVVKQKEPAQLDPEVAESVSRFVEMFVTPSRLEQGVVEACNGEYDMRGLGHFLKWMNADIQKEGDAELEASGLTWKDVNKAVQTAARKWYSDAVKSV